MVREIKAQLTDESWGSCTCTIFSKLIEVKINCNPMYIPRCLYGRSFSSAMLSDYQVFPLIKTTKFIWQTTTF